MGSPLEVLRLDSIGDAGHSQLAHIASKNLDSRSGLLSVAAAPLATRLYICLGVSPSKRYPRETVLRLSCVYQDGASPDSFRDSKVLGIFNLFSVVVPDIIERHHRLRICRYATGKEVLHLNTTRHGLKPVGNSFYSSYIQVFPVGF